MREQPGDGPALEGAITAWKTVFDSIVEAEGVSTPAALAPGEGWTGDAAEAYARRVPIQNDAIVGAKRAAVVMQEHIQWTIDALTDYWSSILNHLGDYLGRLVVEDQKMGQKRDWEVAFGVLQIGHAADNTESVCDRVQSDTDDLKAAMKEAKASLAGVDEIVQTWPVFATNGATTGPANIATDLPKTTGAASGPGTHDYEYYAGRVGS
jgi:hypothetical protein